MTDMNLQYKISVKFKINISQAYKYFPLIFFTLAERSLRN